MHKFRRGELSTLSRLSSPTCPQQVSRFCRFFALPRLWGQDGQSKLENAHVCLLNAGPAGTETMKNLVLPGIGRFTVIDGKTVSKRDLGNNFFVELSSVGKPRASETARLLHELNDFVEAAHSIVMDPEQLIASEPDFVKNYTLIFVTELSEKALLTLGDSCLKHNIPLVVLQTNGLLGYIRIQVSEHMIVESKPDFPALDMRLATAFPALQEYADSYNLATLESGEHSHVPFPVILIKALAEWKATHEGKAPFDSESRDLFKESVLQMARKDEENFTEAYTKAHLAYQETTVPEDVERIISDDKAKAPNAQSPKFWFLAHALGKFVANEGHGKLPLMGTVPDMHAKTDYYVRLQHVYRDQAARDAAFVRGHLDKALAAAGLPSTHITQEEVAQFCKNSLFLKLFRYRSIAAEWGKDGSPQLFAENLPLIDYQTMQPGEGLWYISMRAAWRFHAEKGRYPGEGVADHLSDFPDLRKHADALLQEMGFEADQLEDDYLKEIARFGNSQIHTTGALMGGLTSQEIIKLITHQWTPMNNTYLFNGIRSAGAVFEL